MRRIRISDGEDSVSLLSDLKYKLGGEEENITAKMASKKIVKDIIGYRDVVEIPVGYLSLDDMALLRDMIRRNNGFLTLSYPTPNGDRKEHFVFEDPTFTSIKYNNVGVAVWSDVTLKAVSAEVTDEW